MSNIAAKLKQVRFEKREIPDVGVVQIRQLKTREMLELTNEKDTKTGLKKLVLACVCEQGKPLFSSIEEIDEVAWAVTRALADAAMDVNKIELKDAAKNSPTPPSQA